VIPLGDDDTHLRTVPLVTYAIIAANVAVFVLEFTGGTLFVSDWAFIPRRFLSHPITDFPTLFSAMFMHAGLLHLGGNMLYLWIFGNNIEDRLGPLRFLIFYLACGLAATFTQFLFNFTSRVPNLGASGAIAGVLAAYLVLFPSRWIRVLIGFIIVPLPAVLVIGLWFVLQVISGAGAITKSSEVGGVAYLAHVGGFLAGFVYAFRYRGAQRVRTIP